MKNALIAGISIASLIGTLFVYNKRRKINQIPRAKVLQIAKQLRQQMFLVFVEISCFVKENASKFPPDQLRKYVLDDQGSFKKNIEEKLKQIFVQFSQQQYQENVESFYKNDLQVQYHLKKYQQQFEKAALGVTPQFREQVVTFLNQQKLLTVTKQLLEAKLQRLYEKIQEKMTINDIVLILRVQKQDYKKIRTQNLKQLGLVGKDQELATIFQFSIGKYMKMDQQFNKNMQQINNFYTTKFNQHIDRYCAFQRTTSKNDILSQQ